MRRRGPRPTPTPDGEPDPSRPLVTLDGSSGEGGGQILRSCLTLSMLTGRPFELSNLRAKREGLSIRPQHLAAADAAARLSNASKWGGNALSRDFTFHPGPFVPRDLDLRIHTAGSTALVLQTIQLPIALRAESAVRVSIEGGTFNTDAPSFPFLEFTWRALLEALGCPISLSMPRSGFYPEGNGLLEAWIEPGKLQPLNLTRRGPILSIVGLAGVARLSQTIAERMQGRAHARLCAEGLASGAHLAIETLEWPGKTPGAAISLTVEYEGLPAPVTFVGLGKYGKPAEAVADEAVDQLLAHDAVPDAALDLYSADQMLIPLVFTPGRSEFTVSKVTGHLRTNAETIRAFIGRAITIEDGDGDRPGRVIIE